MFPSEDNRNQAAAPPRVGSRLLIKPGALGDTVVWLPAAEVWEAPRTSILCPAAVVPLVRHLGEARAIESSGLDLLELPGVVEPAALHDYLASFDEIVTWYGSARAEFRDALCAIHPGVRFFDALPPAGCSMHAADFYLEQAGAPLGAVPKLPVARQEGGYAVIHPFSGSSRKNWPLPLFRAVAAELAEEMDVRWCAGPEEVLDKAVRCADVAELASFLAGARVFVGNDAGPAHVAAAVGTPVVAMFGPTDPAVWAPRGKRVRVMNFDATPSEVASAALTV